MEGRPDASRIHFMKGNFQSPRQLVRLAVALSCFFFLILFATATFGASCAPPPSGLFSWWQGNGDASDFEGNNNGVFDTVSFAAGEVGPAFSFDVGGNGVRVPASASLDVGKGAGFTIEAWIKTPYEDYGRPIVEWAPNGGVNGTYGVHFYANFGSGALYANVFGTDGYSHIIQTATGVFANDAWQHVSLTYDKSSGMARLYVNGVLITESNLGSFTPVTNPDLYIGYRPYFVPFGPISFHGLIDEVALYARALEPAELQAIYAAGSAGKCTTPVA